MEYIELKNVRANLNSKYLTKLGNKYFGKFILENGFEKTVVFEGPPEANFIVQDTSAPQTIQDLPDQWFMLNATITVVGGQTKVLEIYLIDSIEM